MPTMAMTVTPLTITSSADVNWLANKTNCWHEFTALWETQGVTPTTTSLPSAAQGTYYFYPYTTTATMALTTVVQIDLSGSALNRVCCLAGKTLHRLTSLTCGVLDISRRLAGNVLYGARGTARGLLDASAGLAHCVHRATLFLEGVTASAAISRAIGVSAVAAWPTLHSVVVSALAILRVTGVASVP